MPYNSTLTSTEIISINYNHPDATKCSTVGCRKFIMTTRLSNPSDVDEWVQDISNNWYHNTKCRTTGTQPAPYTPAL